MKMTEALNNTKKDIIYSCEWPLYQKNSVVSFPQRLRHRLRLRLQV